MTTRVREMTTAELAAVDLLKIGIPPECHEFIRAEADMRMLVVERVRPWFRRAGAIAFLFFRRTDFGFGVCLIGGISPRHTDVYGRQLLTYLKVRTAPGESIRVHNAATCLEGDAFFRSEGFRTFRRAVLPTVQHGSLECWEYQWRCADARVGVPRSF